MSHFTDANRKFFDQLASEDFQTQEPWLQKLTSQMDRAWAERMDWVGVDWVKPGDSPDKQVKLLDYACGQGEISRRLMPHVTTIRGIDISPVSIQKYNEKASAAGISPSQMSAVAGDLLGDDLSAFDSPDYFDFDVITCGAAFHHMHDVQLAANRLAERLKPGGVLIVVDFSEHHHDHVPHELHDVVVHKDGFSYEEMKGIYEKAGLTGFGWSDFEEEILISYKGTHRAKVFFAKGRKA